MKTLSVLAAWTLATGVASAILWGRLGPAGALALGIGLSALAALLLHGRDVARAWLARPEAAPPPAPDTIPPPVAVPARRSGGPYREPPPAHVVDEALAVARLVLLRGLVANVTVANDVAVVRAESPTTPGRVLGSVVLPEQPWTEGRVVAAFLDHIDEAPL